jgi:cytochrome P450
VFSVSSVRTLQIDRGADNLRFAFRRVFLHGKVHADYRKALNVLFTKKALSIYLPIQENIYRKYFKQWMLDPTPEPKPYMMAMRDLNMETSLRVFTGNHMDDAAAAEISDKYWLITVALQLVNFPLALPGTNVYNACQARKVAMKHLTAAAASSKRYMAEGNEPTCLLDAWIGEMIQARQGSGEEEQRRVLSREYTDHEIAMVVLSFLFASQDAMTSAIVFLFQRMSEHPEILAKVREEQYRIRGGDLEQATTLDMVDDMVYTRACVKESLRLTPPVIMVSPPCQGLLSAEREDRDRSSVFLALRTARSPTRPAKPSSLQTITPYLRAPWSSPRSGTRRMTLRLTLSRTSLSRNDGSPRKTESRSWPTSILRTIWFGEVDLTRWVESRASCTRIGREADQTSLAPLFQCIGVQYASMHLAAVIGSASVLMDWEHKVTPESSETQ